MGSSKGLITLLIAIISAFVAVFLAIKWLNKQAAESDYVVVATHNIGLGEKLQETDLKLVKWPKNFEVADTFNKIEPIVGRVLKSGLTTNEPVIGAKLAAEGAVGGLSAVIPEGKRAITVKVNEVIGVAGFALPGNFVDIIVNTQKTNTGDANAQSISKTVLEHIMVLAVGEEFDRDNTQPKKVNVVTLEVTPEQAEMIDLSRSVGELSLILRNQSDNTPNVTAGVTLNQLLNEKKPIVAAAPTPVVIKKTYIPLAKVAPIKKCTQVINGMNETEECF